ncbi:MAG: dihydrodipicolinate synthase family protein [Negativicutes bacterium]|nr:dihydrodipicolinate synthase family protein [Negativicutes bacterium]
MFKPKGVYSAMLTPFTADGEINEPVLREIVEFGITKGLHGLFPVSSVGEFAHMSFEQSCRCMEIVMDAAKGRAAVTPGVSTTCAANSVKLAKKAEELGCQAVVVCPPYYYSITQESIEKHFEIVADSVDLPVILYNIPLFCSPISSDVVERMSRRPNVVGMKDSSGNLVEFMHYMDKVRLAGSEMNFMVGREEILAPALTIGAAGCVTGIAGLLPEVMVGIWDAHHAGDFARANRLQISILAIIRAMFAVSLPLGFKAAMELRGFKMGPPKQPLAAGEEINFSGVKARIKTELQEVFVMMDKEGLKRD